MKPIKSLTKSRKPTVSKTVCFQSSDQSTTLNSLCTNETETRSSELKVRTVKRAEIAHSRYGKDFRKSELNRIKLTEKAKKQLHTVDKNKQLNIIYYRLIKQDYCVSSIQPARPKWCEIESPYSEMDNNLFCKENNRKISVIYKCPELKTHVQRYISLLSKKLKWNKKLVYSYVITQISPERIEVKSEVQLTSLIPYLQNLENPNLPLWDQLCKTIETDTGHTIGNIIVNIHMKQK